MSALLLIASIALSACSGADLGTVCFSDMAAPLVYAYDTGSREALIIERFDDHTANTSYRIETAEIGGEVVIRDSWIVAESGLRDYFSEHWPLR